MKRILYLKSSLFGEHSYSSKLGDAIVDRILAKYPESTVAELDLVATNLPHLSPTVLATFFAAPPDLSSEQQDLRKRSDELVGQLMECDILVVGAPLINFTIPSYLKSWIDHVTRAGITFGYGENGYPMGLVTGKKVYVAMASGGIYSEGPGKENDFVAPYLTTVLGFLGMRDLTIYRAEGVKVPGIKETVMQTAIESIALD
ncbi:FMN-dependent NADH-azoreductase [Pedobacter sandarakinus]|uniref:FMN-dependent NADH-azoreductase n=1 Tax=Pedobacter sandarakinus TaxID=353156 RepID=UPI002247D997|nr:NAD(P)H-dependent oxidoreductase [Pedobacter sandarakinus]MCX2575105.1 NAD(P)H-dependent oxidoreductase [Pedobacter sandarakinus]